MIKNIWVKIKKFGVWKTLLIILVVPNVIYWGAVRPIQVRLEYRQFQQAEQDIEALSQQIITKIGEPDEVKDESSCGRSEQKHTKGPRVCRVSTSLRYKGLQAAEADKYVVDASLLNSSGLRRGSAGIAENLKFENVDQYPQSIFQDSKDISDLNCAFSYTYIADSDKSGSLEISIGCSQKSLADYFDNSD